MEFQKILLCCLMGGHLLAMEEKPSQALAVKKYDEASGPANAAFAQAGIWGKMTSAIGGWLAGTDDDAIRFHNDMKAFLDRWDDGNKVDKLDLAGLRSVVGELEALKRNPYLGNEGLAMISCINSLHTDLCELLAMREKRLAAENTERSTGCVLL